ncbi:MAG: hypothetical protein ABIW79_10680, partial [Gemmatimonas sp.]
VVFDDQHQRRGRTVPLGALDGQAHDVHSRKNCVIAQSSDKPLPAEAHVAGAVGLQMSNHTLRLIRIFALPDWDTSSVARSGPPL